MQSEQVKYLKIGTGHIVGEDYADGQRLFRVRDSHTGQVDLLTEDAIAPGGRDARVKALMVIEDCDVSVTWDSPRDDEAYDHGGRMFLDIKGQHLEAQTTIVGEAAILKFMVSIVHASEGMQDWLLNEHPDNPFRRSYEPIRAFKEALERLNTKDGDDHGVA